ncbi:glycosyltransferase family 39 protein [Thermobrachium celere]|uniref:Putative membrane protein n=1 Tax=Thermobrachium celere DSM 8682 TaxID=941824 RepID=R7RUV5_9CLOT|nr:glycosyltransferase family 39 protein [Thermobrachium celere]CDF59245.1 putative membrane protein [Thermobrachium celere DSM 8682]
MNWFSRFLNVALKILFLPIIFSNLKYTYRHLRYFKSLDIYLVLFFITALLMFTYLLKRNINEKILLIIIILFGAALRLFWVITLDNRPVSDFAGMFIRSRLFLNGVYYMFQNKNYYARYPHMTMTVLYFALIRSLFANSLLAIKVINAILSTLNIFFVYLISKETFNSKKTALYSSFITATYPAFIGYSAVYCSENIAMPFYLFSIYLFILVMKNKSSINILILSGLVLGIGHIFRMVADVVIIAYIMYIIIYFNKNIFTKSKSIIFIVLAFLIPMVTANTILKKLGILQYNLWRGCETKWTSVLRGSNLETYGRWNLEDAKFIASFDDDKKLEEAIKQKVKERYTKTPLPKLLNFFYNKYSNQWSYGDFGGFYWAQADTKSLIVDVYHKGMLYVNLYYFIILLLSYVGLFNKKQYLDNPYINLFYIIFCGYGLLYLITESQSRYSYIVCWLFIFFALTVFRRDEVYE